MTECHDKAHPTNNAIFFMKVPFLESAFIVQHACHRVNPSKGFSLFRGKLQFLPKPTFDRMGHLPFPSRKGATSGRTGHTMQKGRPMGGLFAITRSVSAQ
jgi:hypothetical protein